MISQPTYICLRSCRVIALGEGEEEDESIQVKPGVKGTLVNPTNSKAAQLKLQTGTLVEMAWPVFVAKWAGE